jgi:hypothetical protein
VRLPFPGLFAAIIAIAACLGVRRRRALASLLLFPLPLSATALLIYSDRGTAYYGCFHLLPAGILLATLVQSVLDRVGRLGVRAKS